MQPRRLLAHLMERISRAELARATRIPRSTVTNILRGKRDLSKANVRDLARHFGISPTALLAESVRS